MVCSFLLVAGLPVDQEGATADMAADNWFHRAYYGRFGGYPYRFGGYYPSYGYGHGFYG